MRDLTRRLFDPIRSEAIEREVEEELRFHLDLLTEQNLQHAGTIEEARASALKRFGNVEQVKDECIEISKRSRSFRRALKSFLILVFLPAVSVPISTTKLHVDRFAQSLIAIGAWGRWFFNVVALKPRVFGRNS